MGGWRRLFRSRIVEVLRSIPDGGPDLKVICDFAEAVGADVGPALRRAGWEDPRTPAELFAAQRACYWVAVANEIATRDANPPADGKPRPDQPHLERLAAAYPGDPLLRAGLRRHARMLPRPQALAAERLDARHRPSMPSARAAPRVL